LVTLSATTNKKILSNLFSFQINMITLQKNKHKFNDFFLMAYCTPSFIAIQ